ncbi:MAG: hypothetical protein IPK74_24090 [Deltaproteobacteria bacterium]|nr:hypothetical protein [Deltaproteobacteria bacterium]
MVVLLQAHTQTMTPAVEEAWMNPRWQLVLELLGEEKAPFGQGSAAPASGWPRTTSTADCSNTHRRAREEAWLASWQSLEAAAFDSSPLRGRGRVADTWNDRTGDG